ncbi:MAG: signal peptide peptidase SppA [Cyanobacteriota bacterium]|nr:signal peptide peptidase SppA [Cyanobacteriota bacterium]
MRDFFKYTFATLTGLLLFCGLGIGWLIVLFVSAASTEKGPRVKQDSMLVLDLGVSIQDTQPTSTAGEALERSLSGEPINTLPLRTVVQTLEEAATDDRITGLYIKGSSTPGVTGYAVLGEVRAALKTFRESGKQILAFDRDWSEREYYLGSIANTVAIDPLGIVELNGLGTQTLFLDGALDKYGIGVQVVRVGSYKAAVEPFTRQNNSPENRQQTQKLLSDLWGEYINTVSEYREPDSAAMQSIAQTQGLLVAEEATNQGLVDRIAYNDEIISELKTLTESEEDDESFRKISIGTYADIEGINQSERNADEGHVAVVYATGGIVDGEGLPTEIGGDRFAKVLRELRLDEDVAAVVLRINSPGGSASASETIKREVELIAENKPIVISMGNIAASGGYWIAMKGSHIFAEPTTITGSIGVFGLLFNIQEIANENGLTWDVVKTAPFADTQTVSRPKTEAELAIIQKIVDRIYWRFIREVASSRELTEQRVNEIAQGRVWSGLAAKEIGLVDEIGGLEAAIQNAAQQAELSDRPEVREYPKIPTFEEQLLENLLGDESARTPDPLTEQWKQLQQELASLREMNDPIGVYTRLPYNFRID